MLFWLYEFLNLLNEKVKMENNSESRSIFIWDVQWCYKELKHLLKKIELTENDRVFFVWDLINRGPKSYKVLRLLYQNRKQFKSVVWNHEINFLRYLEWKNYDESNKKTFKKLKKRLKQKPKILEYLKSLPKYIEEDNFILVHAWIVEWKTLEWHDIDEITRVREYNWKPWYEYYKWTKKIIYWHWAVDGLRIRQNTIWLDSGCVYGKNLTAYVLETWEIITQKAFETYHKID